MKPTMVPTSSTTSASRGPSASYGWLHDDSSSSGIVSARPKMAIVSALHRSDTASASRASGVRNVRPAGSGTDGA